MKPPGRRARRHLAGRQPTAAREAVERRWQSRLIEAPRFASMVTAQEAAGEPFHRWLHFKQGYSPALVREFLAENESIFRDRATLPILDPFSGSGTCVIECGRRNIPAIGVEAIPSLAFLVNCAFEKEMPPLSTENVGCAAPIKEVEPRASARAIPKDDWREIAARLEHPLHRAALMLAVSRQHTTSGKPNRGAKPLRALLDEVAAMMSNDLRTPMPRANQCLVGDARDLTALADESIAGILTSPPYLSRHNYSRITAPYEAVYEFWCGAEKISRTKGRKANGKDRKEESVGENSISKIRSSISEITECLQLAGQQSWIETVRQYFQDMSRILKECRRVLSESGIAWVIVGGARLGDVYVPADLILAELAETCGFPVGQIRVARDLVGPRRKLGDTGYVAPRESIIVLTGGTRI